jgi:hypothetical protein
MNAITLTELLVVQIVLLSICLFVLLMGKDKTLIGIVSTYSAMGMCGLFVFSLVGVDASLCGWFFLFALLWSAIFCWHTVSENRRTLTFHDPK